MKKVFKKSLARVVFVSLILVFSLSVLQIEKVFAGDSYKIGGLFEVTGPASFIGDPEKRSIEMAIEEINKAGGIDGKKLEIVIYDTECDPTKAVMGATKLINKDEVLAIVGPGITPTTLAVIPIVEKAKLPLISCAAGNLITNPVKSWVFKTAQNDILAVAAIYKQMQKQNIKTVGIIVVADSFGESGKEQLDKQAQNFGIKILASEKFNAKDTDMTAQITKIKAANPEAIICWGTNPGPAVIAKNIQQLDIKLPFYQSHGVASPKFIELAGNSCENIYLPTGKILISNLLEKSDPQAQIIQNYSKNFKEKYNMAVSGFGGYSYDAMQILAKALKNSNGDKNKIRANIENIKNHVGVTGTFSFSKDEHNGLGSDSFVMVQIKNGSWELLK